MRRTIGLLLYLLANAASTFVGVSAVVPADLSRLSRRIYFVLWFSIGFRCRADKYSIPARKQAVNIVCQLNEQHAIDNEIFAFVSF
jgi:hypothetical protein